MLPSCCTDGTDVKRVNVCVKFSHTTIPLVPQCLRILCHCPLSWKPELIYLRDCNLKTTFLYYHEMRSLPFESVYFCIAYSTRRYKKRIGFHFINFTSIPKILIHFIHASPRNEQSHFTSVPSVEQDGNASL